jgi:hypothetical protein
MTTMILRRYRNLLTPAASVKQKVQGEAVHGVFLDFYLLFHNLKCKLNQ